MEAFFIFKDLILFRRIETHFLHLCHRLSPHMPSPSPGWEGPSISHLLSLQIRRLASRCIQKNVAVFLAVKDWPWWQLLSSLRPLLSATIGDEQLHAKEVGPHADRALGSHPHLHPILVLASDRVPPFLNVLKPGMLPHSPGCLLPDGPLLPLALTTIYQCPAPL